MQNKIYADLVITSANIWTMDEKNTRVQSIAIFGDSIIKIGANSDNSHLIGPKTQTVDAQGNTVIPGFIDAHTHVAWNGMNKIQLDLGDTKSLGEVLERVKIAVSKKQPGEWIIGRNWDQSNWPEQRYITAADLDPISGKNPVFLRHVSGHFMTVNSLGFERLGFSKSLQGVDLDEEGNVIGTLRDIEVSDKEELRPSHEDFINGLKFGMDEALSLGITSIHDNITFELLPAYMDLIERNEMKIRVYGIIYEDMIDEAIKMGLNNYCGDKWLKIGAVKLMTDGAMSARTAYLFEDYDDKPGEKGFALYDESKLDKMISKVHNSGMQIAAHAIGDRAISNVIDAIERNLNPEECKNAMHRIEHSELLRKSDAERAAKYGIVQSLQPNFVWRWGLVGEGQMYEQRVGTNRTMINNPFRWVLDAGSLMIFGSDGMPLGPLYGIKGALFHSNKELRLTLEEAIRCYTFYPAVVSKEDDIKGSIEEGKLADLVILNKNLDTIELEEFHDVDVDKTIVGGKIVYSKSS